ncbi:hypothetical protein [Aliarcobacter butzleri]|uniref:hypothetical protein n=1 Tax=Aliarcobacter butzleri TaxID=28197 RepID=UPI0021B41935|nr:hypothetical protein [Aliarcobacter butzleri]MCT7619182.1 hypothetical protein [Aliarcobacter butzleri]
MDEEDFKKFKIKIRYKNNVPVYPKNPYIEYEKVITRDNEHLFTEIFYDNVIIGKGIILDFYKYFEIKKSDWGNLYTFPLNRTQLGEKIYKIKFYKEPPIPYSLKEQYIESFLELFQNIFDKLNRKIILNKQTLCISYIPSSSGIPNILASKLSTKFDLELKELISKDDSLVSSKNIDDYIESMKHSQKKYKFDTNFIEKNKDSIYLIIDDVFGLGSSIITAMKHFYDITKKINFFFCIVKDTKR